MSKRHMKRYSEGGLFLGRGAYGVVVQAEALAEVNKKVKKGQRVAIKTIDGVFTNRQEARCLLRELHILQLFQGHDSMVQLLDIIPPSDPETFSHMSLVFECAEADLKQVVKSNQQFTSLHVEYIMYQLCNACFYMHSAGVVHRDLKPANILINSNCTIKICDFGLARGINDDEGSNASELLKVDREDSNDREINGSLITPLCTVDNNTHNNENSNDDEDERKPKDARQPENENENESGTANASEKGKEKEKGKKSANESKKPKQLVRQRQPTKHVATRWYRAPEVILLQLKQQHLPAMDMWSVGCILGELLQMNHRFCTDYIQRKCLFPGTTCWPLSGKDSFSQSDRSDQLNVIFSKLGSPTPEEIEKIENSQFKEMVKSINAPPCPIQEIFPAFPVNNEECKKYIKKEKKIRHSIDLMLRLLQFDVEKRISAEQALKHKYFTRVKEPQLEVQSRPVRFEFEHQTLTRKQIREKVLHIVDSFNNQNQHTV